MSPGNTLHFWLDVAKQELFRGGSPMPSPDSLALGRAVAAQLQETDWHLLARYLLQSKHEIIKEADVTRLDATFPKEVMSGAGHMVGYAEIFPLGGAFPFEIGAEAWLADDQYCVNPRCRCREVLFSFVRLPGAGDSRRHRVADQPAARYDYQRGGFETVHAPSADQPELAALFHGMKQAHPDLDPVVKKRHQQLKTLYKRALRSSAGKPSTDTELEPPISAPSSRPAGPQSSAKAGRNDPCPCGSGKKFKKCCGR
jgi:hypothetical protein